MDMTSIPNKGFKICKMQAAIKAMIKCVHLNMSQLYIRVSELSSRSVLATISFSEKAQRETACYIKGVAQTESGQIFPLT